MVTRKELDEAEAAWLARARASRPPSTPEFREEIRRLARAHAMQARRAQPARARDMSAEETAELREVARYVLEQALGEEKAKRKAP